MFSRFWLKKNPFENALCSGALIGQRRMVAEDKKLSEKGVGSIFQTAAGTFCSISSRISERQDLRYRHPEMFAGLRALMKDWGEEMDSSEPLFSLK